ncbi:MAG: hypothetical protein PSX81_03785 [bacterium]|nr:hypothetical protein [bacterium]
MEIEIKSELLSIFNILYNAGQIKIPDSNIIQEWNYVLKLWIEDHEMTLFARKGGETRGSIVNNNFNRRIITTDNTPAHWVFKTIVMDKSRPNKDFIKKTIQENNFPISFVKKRSDIHLIGKMVDPSIRSLNVEWKLAHINKIALSRSTNKTISDYEEHHFKFLSLDNIYLIDKRYSGIAEIAEFNEIVKNHKKAL